MSWTVERIGSATLYLGDSREVWPEVPTHDIIMTDPPYGMDFHSKVSREKGRHDKIAGDDTLDLMDWAGNLENFNTAKYVWGRWHNLHTLPKQPNGCIIWDKNCGSMGDLEHAYGYSYECCFYWPGPEHKWRKKRPLDIIKAPRTGNEFHPTQKPTQLIYAMLEHSVGRTVIDPFMGSGTTGVAAMQLGLEFTGIELNEKYFDICCKRIEDAQRRPDMFAAL